MAAKCKNCGKDTVRLGPSDTDDVFCGRYCQSEYKSKGARAHVRHQKVDRLPDRKKTLGLSWQAKAKPKPRKPGADTTE